MVKFEEVTALWRVKKAGSKVKLSGKAKDGVTYLVVSNDKKENPKAPDYRILRIIEGKSYEKAIPQTSWDSL